MLYNTQIPAIKNLETKKMQKFWGMYSSDMRHTGWATSMPFADNFLRFACFQNGKRKIGGFERLSFFWVHQLSIFFASIHENQPQIMGLHGWDSILMITLVSRITGPVRLFFVRIFFHPVWLIIEILLYVYLFFLLFPLQ